MAELASFVSAALAARADPEKAPKMAAYMKTEMPFYGVQRPGRREIQRAMLQQFRPASPEEYEGNVLRLWQLPHREEKYLALDYARGFSKQITSRQLPLYERLIREGAWWDLVDDVASNLVGRVWKRERAALSGVMDRWSADELLWIRRTAIIGQLKHKEHTDRERLFRYCRERAHEKEFFIRKAIGWALREYAKTDPGAVQAFVDAQRSALSALSLREAEKQLQRSAERGS